MEKLCLAENGISPTRAIYNILKPYWQRKELEDQHWAYVLACLRNIETRCRECREEADAKRRLECMNCIERKILENI